MFACHSEKFFVSFNIAYNITSEGVRKGFQNIKFKIVPPYHVNIIKLK